MEGLVMKYFVLKPKAKSYYDMYARASQAAIIAYARTIEIVIIHLMLLFKELKNLIKVVHILPKVIYFDEMH